ncbi:MAG: hypothetical protein U1F31_06715 [Steroidobacteraceae bacterium]
MNRRTLRALVLALTTSLAGTAQAQLPQPTLQTRTLTTTTLAQAPIRIVRKPASLQRPAATITHRVMSKSTLSGVLSGGLKLDTGALAGRLPSGPPTRRALVVILENGGVMNNVDPALRQALNVNINTVTCGNWEFQLRSGETIVDLIARVASQLAGNITCLNPANWRQQTFNPYSWLNDMSDQAIEDAVKSGSSLLNTQSRYDTVAVMEDADAVPDRVVNLIKQLAPGYVIDVHVLTHGGNEGFVGHNGQWFMQNSFFGPLQAYRTSGKPLHLRAVYQMNCVSGTLKDNWTALGAIVVNGTQQQYNNNMPHQYFHFLGHWLGIKGMSDSSQRSYDEAALYTRPIYSLVGKSSMIEASRLTTAGTNQSATVTTAF